MLFSVRVPSSFVPSFRMTLSLHRTVTFLLDILILYSKSQPIYFSDAAWDFVIRLSSLPFLLFTFLFGFQLMKWRIYYIFLYCRLLLNARHKLLMITRNNFFFPIALNCFLVFMIKKDSMIQRWIADPIPCLLLS